jgi:hypothetical protein
MKHPKIIPGRRGLPATSNIPWSATAELEKRKSITGLFVALCMAIVTALTFFLIRMWLDGALFAGATIPVYLTLQRERRILYAMILNRPRDTSGLTQWTQHSPIASAGVLDCSCGRRFVLVKPENFFKGTGRFSAVCECGRGHFTQLSTPLRVVQ